MADNYRNKETPWRNEELLREMYWEDQMSKEDIAKELECSRTTVDTWFDKLDIEQRDKSEVAKLSKRGNHPWHDEELLREMYWEKGMTQEEIADELGTTGPVITKWMDRNNIEVRDRSYATHLGRGGKGTNGISHFFESRGYERIRVKDVDGDSTIRIHRLVAVAEYGFDEVVNKVVHHSNEVKWDNRPENLELKTYEEHGRLHSSLWKERGEGIFAE